MLVKQPLSIVVSLQLGPLELETPFMTMTRRPTNRLVHHESKKMTSKQKVVENSILGT